MRDYRLYLRDIHEAIVAIEGFVEGMSFDEFAVDDKTSSAVIRKFEIIGEASKKVPTELRCQGPDIPWREMAGMRDKLIHFYFGANYELIWRTITERLPILKKDIKSLLASMRPE